MDSVTCPIDEETVTIIMSRREADMIRRWINDVGHIEENRAVVRLLRELNHQSSNQNRDEIRLDSEIAEQPTTDFYGPVV